MENVDPYPLVLLGLGVLTIFVLILRLKVNAFLALIGAALLVGLLSPKIIFDPIPESEGGGQRLNLVRAPEIVSIEFGVMMGKIGIAIALATIIGKALMDSGAADRIVRFFTSLFGEKRASLALLLSGFVLAIPVFFDTVFFLLVPLAKALRLRTGKNYLLYITAIGAGGAITHSLVPPTPGPLGMSVNLKVDLGLTIMVGVLVGIPMSLVGYLYALWINRVAPVPLRQVGDVPLEQLEAGAHRPTHELPSLFASFLPILLPVLLITSATLFGAAVKQNPNLDSGFDLDAVRITAGTILNFLGDPKMALLISAVLSMGLVASQNRMNRRQLGDFTAKALDEAGMILLVTCAGGSFGKMLELAGVGQSLGALAKAAGISILVLAWGLAVMFKLAQGSGTVSMLTTSGIIFGLLKDEGAATPELMAAYLTFHPVYLVMAIGAGSVCGSWMNDSGFWVFCKMSGLTESETLRSWTVTLAVMGLAGLPIIWGLTLVLPLV